MNWNITVQELRTRGVVAARLRSRATAIPKTTFELDTPSSE